MIKLTRVSKTQSLLFENGSFNGAVNRLYYALFYAVIALLIKEKIETKSHDGVRRMLNQHFIHNSKIDLKFGKLYSKLFDWRERGDYGDLFDFKKEDVEPLFSQVSEMMDLIKQITA